MYILIILPKRFQCEEYNEITINPKVPFSKIFSIEETLKNLNKSLLNLVEEIQNLLLKYKQKEFSVEKKLSEYVIKECNVIEIMKEGEETYEKIRGELKEYKFTTKNTKVLNELKNNIKLVFLDCLCVICEPEKEKSLEAVLNKLGIKESSEKIRSDNLNIYYRVYCIKSETDAIMKSINDAKKIKCVKVEKINEIESEQMNNEIESEQMNNKLESEQMNNENCTDYTVIKIIKNKQNLESEYVDFLLKKVNEANKAYINTLFAKSCVESIQRYGTSTTIQYRIIQIEEKKCDKYCQKITKELHKQKIIEEISDEEECPFTRHVIFKNAEDVK